MQIGSGADRFRGEATPIRAVASRRASSLALVAVGVSCWWLLGRLGLKALTNPYLSKLAHETIVTLGGRATWD